MELLQEYGGVGGSFVRMYADNKTRQFVIECEDVFGVTSMVRMEHGTAFLFGNFAKSIVQSVGEAWKNGYDVNLTVP